LAAIKNRLTVVETAYHQIVGERPSQVERRFTRELAGGEQLWERRLRVVSEWQPIDLGWIDRPGLLILANEEGRWDQVNPTPAERAEAAAKILEVAFLRQDDLYPLSLADLLVLPGESSRVHPADGVTVYVRCTTGCRMTVWAFPS
jgi:hypothetical protein